MTSQKANTVYHAISILNAGGIIAYPTEAVYGLGCDPFNEIAVKKLLKLKQRSITQGLILLAHSWQVVEKLTLPIAPELLEKALSTWPGPITWLFPTSPNLIPYWIRGDHQSVAIRITAHKVATTICKLFGGPIVSTSANLHNQTAARSSEAVKKQFLTGIDCILNGETDPLLNPTPIYDVITGKAIRI